MESDLSLINKIKQDNDENSLNELILRHSGIYINIIKRYTNTRSLLDRSSIIEDKDYEIYNAAIKFDPSKKTKFSTHLANQAKWKCLNLINKIQKKNEVSFDNLKRVKMETSDFTDTIRKTEAWDTFAVALEEESDERIKKIIDSRYNTDNNKLVPWRVVAIELKMSIQGCINLHNRFIKKVKTQLENV